MVIDFYAGRPALTVNTYGHGQAYYIATNPDHTFLSDFYDALDARVKLLHAIDAKLPCGISAQVRSDGKVNYVFLMNFNTHPETIDVGANTYMDLLTSETLTGTITMPGYDVKVLVTNNKGEC